MQGTLPTLSKPVLAVAKVFLRTADELGGRAKSLNKFKFYRPALPAISTYSPVTNANHTLLLYMYLLLLQVRPIIRGSSSM